MNFLIVATALSVVAVSAQAEVIRWTYTEPTLILDHFIGDISNENYPVNVPALSGPITLSFDMETDYFSQIGRAPVSIGVAGGFEYLPLSTGDAEPVVFNVDVSVPNINLGWNFFFPLSFTIETDGTIQDWYTLVTRVTSNHSLNLPYPYNGDPNGKPSDTVSTLTVFGWAWDAHYRGTGTGQWTRTGGDEIFAAPVPLPATGLLLVGGLAGLAGARRIRSAA